MDQLLDTEEGVICYLDDVLIFGRNKHECYQTTEKVLAIFTKRNVKIRQDKSIFFTDHIKYLGFEISGKEIKVSGDNSKSIINAPEPTNSTQVKTYLGMAMFYHRHIPNMSMLSSNLHKLTLKKMEWN